MHCDLKIVLTALPMHLQAQILWHSSDKTNASCLGYEVFYVCMLCDSVGLCGTNERR